MPPIRMVNIAIGANATKPMTAFDAYIAVDWSASNSPSPAVPSADAVWIGQLDARTHQHHEQYWRTRQAAEASLLERLLQAIRQKERVLIGFDFNLGFTAGFAEALGLSANQPAWLATWALLNQWVTDDDRNRNNRFEVASALNTLCHSSQAGPLWGCPKRWITPHLKPTSPLFPFITGRGVRLSQRRITEYNEPKSQPVWKLLGVGSVGSQTLTGVPMVYRLLMHPSLAPYSVLWPQQTGFRLPPCAPNMPCIVFVELYHSQLPYTQTALIKDQAQVRATVAWIHQQDVNGTLAHYFALPPTLDEAASRLCEQEEGWFLGSGYLARSRQSVGDGVPDQP